MMNYNISEELLTDLLTLAGKHNLLIASHTDGKESNANQFRCLLKKFPSAKLILCHAFPLDDCLELVNTYENVYIDTSYTACHVEVQGKAVKTIGKVKILFGIDSPLGFPTQNGKYKPHFREFLREAAVFYDNDDDVFAHVLYKNAKRFLNLQDDIF